MSGMNDLPPHSMDEAADSQLLEWVHRWLAGEPVMWNGVELRFPNGAGYAARVLDHLCEGQHGYNKRGRKLRNLTEAP